MDVSAVAVGYLRRDETLTVVADSRRMAVGTLTNVSFEPSGTYTRYTGAPPQLSAALSAKE